ncbi:MAG: matrixin family metalloprotease [Bdellovibrio sp.]|nr:matrixin family metalloprotease [Bdellovibrio sp.]
MSGCGENSSSQTSPIVTSPYSEGEQVPLRWSDSSLSDGIPLKIASEVASALDFGEGNNGHTDDAMEWNRALPDRTLFALPMPLVANRQHEQLISYYDNEMGIYKSEKWFSELGEGVLAITQFFAIRRYQAGQQYLELQHSDIILNYRDYSFSWDLKDASSYDLPSVLLHEMGHFVGLPHVISTALSAMWPALKKNEIERQLYPIDIQNLQANYVRADVQSLSTNPDSPSGVRANAITVPKEEQLVRGYFELRADGLCRHFINGRSSDSHVAFMPSKKLSQFFFGLFYF